jgi:hypothetical protein
MRSSLSKRSAVPGIAFVRLSRLFRTSSFRLTLIYAGLFAVSAIILFGVIYWTTASFMEGQFDASVGDELNEVLGDAGGGGADSLRVVVLSSVRRDQKGWFYQMKNAAGEVLAGNLPTPARFNAVGEQRDGRRTVTIASRGAAIRGASRHDQNLGHWADDGRRSRNRASFHRRG